MKVVVMADWTGLGAAAANSSPNADSNWKVVIIADFVSLIAGVSIINGLLQANDQEINNVSIYTRLTCDFLELEEYHLYLVAKPHGGVNFLAVSLSGRYFLMRNFLAFY